MPKVNLKEDLRENATIYLSFVGPLSKRRMEAMFFASYLVTHCVDTDEYNLWDYDRELFSGCKTAYEAATKYIQYIEQQAK